MNYLAHAYLSGMDYGIITGNFIADQVKGKKYKNYPEKIQKGIILHRKIDTFTDLHQKVSQSKRLLYPSFGKFASVIIDIFFDYFLAKGWENYSSIPLNEFAENYYKILYLNKLYLPGKSLLILKFMSKDNWLLNYSNIEGIEKALAGIDKRTKFNSQMKNAVNILISKEKIFQMYFNTFFIDLINYIKKINKNLK